MKFKNIIALAITAIASTSLQAQSNLPKTMVAGHEFYYYEASANESIYDIAAKLGVTKDYIIKNYPYELKLQTLADIASMSQSAFSRFFKLHTGRTLSDYIIDIRLGYATRMLLDTNDTIADISFKCGYNNLSNFNRTFRRKKGCTPREFRENFRKIRIIV